jgi:hypothetical protein
MIAASGKTKWILLFFLLLAVLILLSIKPLRQNSPLFNLVFPPADLYSVLDASSVDLTAEGGTTALNFANRYPGQHTIGILVERPTPTARSYRMDFALDIAVRRDHEVLLAASVNEPYMLFWGGEGNSGIAMLKYTVPGQLPLGVPLRAEVTVVRPDPEFPVRYGSTTLYVKKMSDE